MLPSRCLFPRIAFSTIAVALLPGAGCSRSQSADDGAASARLQSATGCPTAASSGRDRMAGVGVDVKDLRHAVRSRVSGKLVGRGHPSTHGQRDVVWF
jgi:hypothetical protein